MNNIINYHDKLKPGSSEYPFMDSSHEELRVIELPLSEPDHLLGAWLVFAHFDGFL